MTFKVLDKLYLMHSTEKFFIIPSNMDFMKKNMLYTCIKSSIIYGSKRYSSNDETR